VSRHHYVDGREVRPQRDRFHLDGNAYGCPRGSARLPQPEKRRLQPDEWACITCHQADFMAPRTRTMLAGGFSQSCQIVSHNLAWQPATWLTTPNPSFPLTGFRTPCPTDVRGWAIAPQLQHHEHGLHFRAIRKDFDNATSPYARGFPYDLPQCHDHRLQWTDCSNSASTPQTGFPLTGSHTVPHGRARIATSTTNTS